MGGGIQKLPAAQSRMGSYTPNSPSTCRCMLNPYDFQRFSPAGHRMLHPQFDIVHLTRVGGPIGCLSLTLIVQCRFD